MWTEHLFYDGGELLSPLSNSLNFDSIHIQTQEFLMLSILLSIKPFYAYCIAIGLKTVELRARAPRENWSGFVECYISRDMTSLRQIPQPYRERFQSLCGSVALSFRCPHIGKISNINGRLDVDERLKNSVTCVPVDSVLQLSKHKPLFGFQIVDPSLHSVTPISNFVSLRGSPLTKPPQSWCYVDL